MESLFGSGSKMAGHSFSFLRQATQMGLWFDRLTTNVLYYLTFALSDSGIRISSDSAAAESLSKGCYKVELSHYLKIVMGESRGGKPLWQRAWGMCPQEQEPPGWEQGIRLLR